MKSIPLVLFFISPLFSFSQQSIDSIFSNAHITGVQLVAVDHGKSEAHFYGVTEGGKKDSINAKTVFQAASLSKAVLAYIVLKMLDRQQIALDTPLANYFKYDRIQADTAARKITARMVLHHQTGFANWAANPTSREWFRSKLSVNFMPGSSWSYSGEGFMYLQYAVEHIFKASLEKIASEEVFVPLNMISSSFIWQPSFEQTAAYGHNKNGETTGRNEPFVPAAAYSLLTTAADYSLFLQALVSGKGLSKTSHRLMLTDTVSVKKMNTVCGEACSHIAWGLGMGIQKNELGTAIWHWGDNGDFKCFFMAFPGSNNCLAYFTNSENGLDPMQQVLDYYFGKNTWWSLKWLDKEF